MKKTVVRPLSIAAFATLTLGACSDETSVDDPNDPEQVAAAAQTLVKPQPGQYEVTSELIEFEMPGLGEDEQQMMRGMMEGGFSQTTSYCLTPEEADKGWQDAVENMQNAEGECEYSRFETSGDTLNAEMSCNNTDGSTAEMTMTGELSETGQDITMAMSGRSPEMPGGEMNMTMRMVSKRTGECEG